MHGDKDILYGFSAFRLHRIPYQVLMLCPPMPSLWDNVRSPLIPSHPVIKEIIGSPVHVLVTDRKDRRTAKAVRTHLVESQLPPGAIEDSELNIKTCSPLFTLLTLARHLDTVELAMAMYEFCGKFSVFKPTPEIEKLLCSQEARALNDGPKAWKRVKSTARATSGKASALWVRPPLINLDELQNYASQCPHIHGRKRFEQAARLVTGVTASPFEVQLSLLLALPKEMGGKGMPFFSNNGKIPLPREARSICKCNNGYADLLFDGDGTRPALDVECQGAIIHNDNYQILSDADRATALAALGIETLWITYRQIIDPESFQSIAKLIASKIGCPFEKPDSQARRKEHELRRALMIDWADLCMPSARA